MTSCLLILTYQFLKHFSVRSPRSDAKSHTKKRPEESGGMYSTTVTDLSRTVAGQEDNAETTAHAGTSVFALRRQL